MYVHTWMLNQGCGDCGVAERPGFQDMALERPMNRLSGDVVPIGLGLVIDEENQAVVEAAGAEVMFYAIDDGGQTDPTIANASKRDQVRGSRQSALGHVGTGELAHHKRRLSARLHHDD